LHSGTDLPHDHTSGNKQIYDPLIAMPRQTRSQSAGLDVDEEMHTMSKSRTSRRHTRSSRMSSSVHDRSIAETEVEAGSSSSTNDDAHEPASSSGGEDVPAAAITTTTSRTANPQANRYSFHSFVRSPYLTRSTSRNRTHAPAFSSRLLVSDRKALSFAEETGEEDEDEQQQPGRASYTTPAADRRAKRLSLSHAPNTPAQEEAHDDADVYRQDVCGHHDVAMPDGSMYYRTSSGRKSHSNCDHEHHSHGHRRRSKHSTTISSTDVDAVDDTDLTSSSLSPSSPSPFWSLLLLTFLLAMVGPWAVRHIVNQQDRTPDFVVTDGQSGGVITQAQLDSIIQHVLNTVEKDLSSRRLVDEPRLDAAGAVWTTNASTQRDQAVRRAVEETLAEVDQRLQQALRTEHTNSETALSDARKDILEIVDRRFTAARTEWMAQVSTDISSTVAGERSDREKAIQSLLSDLATLRAEESDARSSLHSSLRKEVLDEVEKMFHAFSEHSSKQSTEHAEQHARQMKELEDKMSKMLELEKESDATKLSEKLHDLRIEFQSTLQQNFESNFKSWEQQLRTSIMEEAEKTFAPLSAVLNKESESSEGSRQLDEDLLMVRLKAHVDKLISQIEFPTPPQPNPIEIPKPVDEAALESRVVQVVRQQLDRDLSKLSEENQQKLSEQLSQSLSQTLSKELSNALENESRSVREATLESVRRELPDIIQPLIPPPTVVPSTSTPEPTPTPAPAPAVDHSKELAEMEQRIAALAQELERVNEAKEAASKAAATAAELKAEVARLAAEYAQRAQATPTHTPTIPADSSVASQISEALELYSADRTGMVDYALRSSGGRILAHSPAHQVALQSSNWLFGMIQKCFLQVRKPEEVITDTMSVGSCWPMNGTSGFVSLGLRDRIIPTHVTLQHISPRVAPDPTTTPKDVTIWGVPESKVDELRSHTPSRPIGVRLGRFTYSSSGPQVQTFELKPDHDVKHAQTPFAIITAQIDSNYGNPAYTCIYRIRVHGKRT